MFFEIEDETRDFSTFNRTEYYAKKLRKLYKSKPFFSEYSDVNPITDAYKEYLYIEKQNDRLPFHKRSESLKENLKKVRNERPHLKKFLPRDPPDEAVIEREQKNLGRSVYQLDFGRSSDDRDSQEKELHKVRLPDDYFIPESIQRKFFRNPRVFDPRGLLKNKGHMKIPDNLVVNQKEREILRVRTGYTEYQGCINKVGRRIMKEQFYGPPRPVDPPKEQIKGPDSPRSVCSQIRLHASNKIVLSQIF